MKKSESDADQFAREMADVVPLAQDPRGRVRAARPVGVPLRSLREETSREPRGRPHNDADDAGDADSFVAPGVDRREIKKLTRGEDVPGHRLDLHGMTAAHAITSVTRFIDSHRGGTHRAHRCVCIVHGRGLHSEGQVSVLKARVRECLKRHRSVLAYADAPRSDGGAGAVYVLLRK